MAAVTIAAASALIACGSQPAADAKGDAQAGQAAYTKNCAACHGASAEGGLGPKLAGTKLAVSAVSSKVRAGAAPRMPAFDAAKVSDQDIANIHAWLQTK